MSYQKVNAELRSRRFWLFAGKNYYPLGGMDDFVGSFDSVREAQDFVEKGDFYQWYQVLDTAVPGGSERGVLHQKRHRWIREKDLTN